MRVIVFASLILGVISQGGCQSHSVSYQVQSDFKAVKGSATQHHVQFTIIEVSPNGKKALASPKTIVVNGQEQQMRVHSPYKGGRDISCVILMAEDSLITSTTISKKGKELWSSHRKMTFSK